MHIQRSWWDEPTGVRIHWACLAHGCGCDTAGRMGPMEGGEVAERLDAHLSRTQLLSQILLGPYDFAAVNERIRVAADRLAPGATFTIALADDVREGRGQVLRYDRGALTLDPERPAQAVPAAPLTMRFGDRTIGTLSIESTTAGETEVLHEVARIAATAFLNARLLQETRTATATRERYARRLELLAGVELPTTVAEDDLHSVYQRIVDAARGAIAARYAALLVLDEKGSEVAEFVHSGMPADIAARIGHPPTAKGLIGETIRTGLPVRSDNVAADPRSSGFPTEHPPVRTLLGVPLIVQGHPIGSFYFGDRAGGRKFSDEDERLARAFAAHATTAIVAARAHAQMSDLVREATRSRTEIERLAAEREAILEHMASTVVVVDATGRLTYLNRAGREMVNEQPQADLPLQDQVGRFSIREARTGRPLRPEETAVARALAGVTVIDHEFRIRSTANVDRWLRASAAPIRNSEGHVTGAVGVYVDVTAVWALHDARAASEARLRAMYDAMPSGVIISDGTGAIVEANETACRLLVRSLDELVDGRAISLGAVAGEDGAELAVEDQPGLVALRTRQPVHDRRIAVTRPDGERCWLRADAVPVLDDHGAVVQVIITLTDVTDRARGEEELRLHSRQQEALIALGENAVAGENAGDLMDRAAQLVSSTLGVEFVKAVELLPGGRDLKVRAGRGWRQGVIGELILDLEMSVCGRAIRSSGPVVISDLMREMAQRSALLVEHRVTSAMCVPIGGPRGPIGALGAFSAEPRAFGPEEVRFLRAVAQVLASARGRKEEEDRRLERHVLLGRLTPREREILGLMTEGLDNRDIAAQLGISYTTVRGHVRGVIEKLDVRSKLEAVAHATALGLLGERAP